MNGKWCYGGWLGGLDAGVHVGGEGVGAFFEGEAGGAGVFEDGDVSAGEDAEEGVGGEAFCGISLAVGGGKFSEPGEGVGAEIGGG